MIREKIKNTFLKLILWNMYLACRYKWRAKISGKRPKIIFVVEYFHKETVDEN